MRCPNCGKWNAASLPRCFHCGAELTAASPAPEQDESPQPASKIYIQVNEMGQSSSLMDEKDKLALEMRDLVSRKERGEMERQRLRRDSAAQGIAPSGRNVESMSGRPLFPTGQYTSYETEEPAEGDVRPDAIPVMPTISYDEYDDPYYHAPARSVRTAGMTGRRVRVGRRRGHRFFRVLALLMMASGVALAAYVLLLKPLVLDKREAPLQERAIITPTILNDMPAHKIMLPAQEGASIYIKELRKSYTVVGGYATIEVEDYNWYENTESVSQETVTATITPFIRTAAGEQKPMDVVHFEVEIPLSPLTLITPDTGYAEVATALYNIQFEVARSSTVTINGEDFSDLVSTQDGMITYNASVSPIGDNTFTIVTRSQYYRENTVTVTIYRAPQQIRLDLAADTASRYSPNLVEDTSQPKDEKGQYPMKEDPMVIRGTTVTWADIEIKSPYANLDLTNLRLDGSFSFEPVFTKIGTNTIIIEASAPGYETSVVKHDVYYIPIASVYTRKAWDMCTQYSDYLNHSETRIQNTTIYICQGTITQIMSESPQLAIMSLYKDPTKTVLIENFSNDTWAVGQELRIYADAYGVYNNMPRLNGRYTYEKNW